MKKAAESSQASQTEMEAEDIQNIDDRTPAAKRKAVSRGLKNLPLKPAAFANTMKDIHKKASPRKQVAMKKRGLRVRTSKTNLAELLEKEASNKQNPNNKILKRALLSVIGKCASISETSKLLRTTRRTVSSIVKNVKKKINKRKKKTLEYRKEISNFFDEAAVPLPSKKHVSRKTGKAQAVLKKPLKDYHKDYTEKGGKASFALFAKCRPKHIRKMGHNLLNQCLCEYCANAG